MSGFQDRPATFAEKFTHEEAHVFRLKSRAAKITGQFLADHLRYSSDKAKLFAESLVRADLQEPGDEDLRATIKELLAESNANLDDSKINGFLSKAREQAASELTQS